GRGGARQDPARGMGGSHDPAQYAPYRSDLGFGIAFNADPEYSIGEPQDRPCHRAQRDRHAAQAARPAQRRNLKSQGAPCYSGSVQLSEKARQAVLNGRPSRSRAQGLPNAATPSRLSCAAKAGINMVLTP